MALQLPRLQRVVDIVASNRPTLAFHRWWQSVAESLEDAVTRIEGNAADLATVSADTATNTASLAAAAVSLASLDARLDAYDALAPYVRQDQIAAPSYTAYAGQTVSNPPTQAEMQSLDNAVKALSLALIDLRSALQTANVLT